MLKLGLFFVLGHILQGSMGRCGGADKTVIEDKGSRGTQVPIAMLLYPEMGITADPVDVCSKETYRDKGKAHAGHKPPFCPA